MLGALEGFIVILALIFIFGIVSLPPRSRKTALRIAPKNGVTQQGVQNGLSGKSGDSQKGMANGSDNYVADQKVAPASHAAEGV